MVASDTWRVARLCNSRDPSVLRRKDAGRLVYDGDPAAPHKLLGTWADSGIIKYFR
jgi:hypothetical protein